MVNTPIVTPLASTIVNIPIRTHLAHNVHVRTMAMVNTFVGMHLAPTIVDVLIKKHPTHNSTFINSFETQIKINYAFHITKNMSHYNLMKLPKINHKSRYNEPHPPPYYFVLKQQVKQIKMTKQIGFSNQKFHIFKIMIVALYYLYKGIFLISHIYVISKSFQFSLGFQIKQ